MYLWSECCSGTCCCRAWQVQLEPAADSCAADGLVQWHSLHACSPQCLAPSCCQLATRSVRCAPVLQLCSPFAAVFSSNIILACCFEVKDAALCTMHNVVCHVLQPMLSSRLHVSATMMLVLPFCVHRPLPVVLCRCCNFLLCAIQTVGTLLPWLLNTFCNVICPAKTPTFFKMHQTETQCRQAIAKSCTQACCV